MTTVVQMGANIKKTSERINTNGDVINPKTREVLQANIQEEIRPSVDTITGVTPRVNGQNGLSILEQISEAKKNLADLEKLKKLQIQQKKAELELLEQ